MIFRAVGQSIDPIYVSGTLGHDESGTDSSVDLSTCNYAGLIGSLDLAGVDAGGVLHAPFDVQQESNYAFFTLKLFFDDPAAMKFIVSRANAPNLTLSSGFKASASKRKVEW
jgi:hypothetical protein